MKPGKPKRILKKALKAGLYLSFLLIFLLISFEIIYRNQIVDTYATELNYFNSPEELNPTAEKPTLLILGDSYTAGNYTYAHHLKSILPSHRVINAGISGTGIIQTNFIAPGRIDRFKPKTVIYQIYTGNDLLDISYPINWQTHSPIKNLYWLLAEQFRGLAFLNYRLGQIFRSQLFAPDPNTKLEANPDEQFSPEKYSTREKSIIAAEPDFLEKTLYLQGKRSQDAERLILGLKELNKTCQAASANLVLLIIPHPAQLNPKLESQFLSLGGILKHPPTIPDKINDFESLIQSSFRQHANVTVLSALSSLDFQSRYEPVYFVNDPHLNPAGQKALAEFLKGSLDFPFNPKN